MMLLKISRAEFLEGIAAGRYRLPWENEVRHTDGPSSEFPKPTRRYGERLDRAAG
jgi:formamidase